MYIITDCFSAKMLIGTLIWKWYLLINGMLEMLTLAKNPAKRSLVWICFFPYVHSCPVCEILALKRNRDEEPRSLEGSSTVWICTYPHPDWLDKISLKTKPESVSTRRNRGIGQRPPTTPRCSQLIKESSVFMGMMLLLALYRVFFTSTPLKS